MKSRRNDRLGEKQKNAQKRNYTDKTIMEVGRHVDEEEASIRFYRRSSYKQV